MKPVFGSAPKELTIDPACPRCGRAELWRVVQTLGETPGLPGHPAQRGGVVCKCGHCGCEAEYRDLPYSDTEQSHRTAALFLQAARKFLDRGL